MWVLILLISVKAAGYSGQGVSAAVTMSSVAGFTSEKICRAAGNKVVNNISVVDADRVKKDFECVKQ